MSLAVSASSKCSRPHSLLCQKSHAEGEPCPVWPVICQVMITVNKSLCLPFVEKKKKRTMQVPQGWLWWLPPEGRLIFLRSNKHRFGISQGTGLCCGESAVSPYPGWTPSQKKTWKGWTGSFWSPRTGKAEEFGPTGSLQAEVMLWEVQKRSGGLELVTCPSKALAGPG